MMPTLLANTRRQKILFPSPSRGIDVSKDATLLDAEYAPYILGFEARRQRLVKDRGYKPLMNKYVSIPDEDNPVVSIEDYPKLDGTVNTVIFRCKDAYKVNEALGTYEKINDEPFTGDIDDRFSSVVMNDLLIASNGIDKIKKWNGTGLMQDLVGATSYRAKSLAVFYNYLLLIYTIESGNLCPHRIRWSDTGNPEVWDSGNAGFVDLSDRPDFLVTSEVLGNYLYIYKERNIYRAFYVGYPAIFNFEPVIEGVGLAAAATLVSLGNTHLFLGWDNIYEFDGRSLFPIGDPVRDMLYGVGGSLNTAYMQRSFAIYVEEFEEYWLFTPSTTDLPDHCVKFNTRERSWTKRPAVISFPSPDTKRWVDWNGYWADETDDEDWIERLGDRTLVTAGYWTRQQESLWQTNIQPWNEDLTRWNDRLTFAGAPLTLFGSDDGQVFVDDFALFTDDGLPVISEFQTKDFAFPGEAGTLSQTRYIRMSFVCSGVKVLVSHSLDGGQTWSEEKEYVLTSLPKRYYYNEINHTSERCRFRFRTQDNFEFYEGVVEVIPRVRA